MSDPSPGNTERPTVSDLPLILENLQDQLDDLRQTVEAQHQIIASQSERLEALERVVNRHAR